MGSYMFTGKCPWSTLGVQVNASSSCVREAYLKLALRWHPDQNNGCAHARHRFQQIKEAFEEIQRRQTVVRDSKSHYSGHSQTSYSQSSSRYCYKTPLRNAKARNSFYNFRRDRRTQESATYTSASDYARAQQHVWKRAQRRVWDRGTIHNMHAHNRVMRHWAVGFMLGSVIFGSAFLSLSSLWRINNRGRSFEELMERLNSNSSTRPSTSKVQQPEGDKK